MEGACNLLFARPHVGKLKRLHATHFGQTAFNTEGIVVVKTLPNIQAAIEQNTPSVIDLKMACMKSAAAINATRHHSPLAWRHPEALRTLFRFKSKFGGTRE